MPTAEILATGNSAARSSTVTLSQTEVNTFLLRASNSAKLLVQQQASDGSWITIGDLTSSSPSKTVNGPGVFSLLREMSPVGVAADAAS